MSRRNYHIFELNSTASSLEASSTNLFRNNSIFTVWPSHALSSTSSSKLVNQSTESTIMQLLLVAMTMAVSFAGNILILLSVYKFAYMRSISSYLVANLAVIDFGLSFLILPTVAATIANQHWMLNEVLCVSAGCIDTLLTNAQVMALLAIGVNRYMAMLHPQWYHSHKSKRLFIGFLIGGWLYSVLWTIPPFLGWGRYSYAKGTLFCGVSWNETPYFAISHLVVSYVMPSLTGLYFYIGVVRAVFKYVQQIGALVQEGDMFEHVANRGSFQYRDEIIKQSISRSRSVPLVTTSPSTKAKNPAASQIQNITIIPATQSINSKRLWQVTKAFLIIVITFLTCWIPRGIANIWAVIEGRDSVPVQLEVYSTLLIFATSALNPIVYGFCRADFRQAFKAVLIFWRKIEDER